MLHENRRHPKLHAELYVNMVWDCHNIPCIRTYIHSNSKKFRKTVKRIINMQDLKYTEPIVLDQQWEEKSDTENRLHSNIKFPTTI